MKALLAICVMLLAPTVQSYEIARAKNGAWIQWASSEITITIDPSMTDIRDDAVAVIETAFMTWLDYVDADITVNFVKNVCDAKTSSHPRGVSRSSTSRNVRPWNEPS